jgi:hypothetical protein
MRVTRTLRTAAVTLAAVTSIGMTAAAQSPQVILPPSQSCASCTHGPNETLRPVQVPAGTWIRARINTYVSTHRNETGSAFFASVVQPVYDANGNVLIPENTRLVGRVLESERGHRLFGRGAQLAIGVDAMNIRGAYVPLSGRVEDVPRNTYRTGLLRRQQARLPAGTVFSVQLQAPITVGMIRETTAQPTAVGGGPCVVRRHTRVHEHARGGGPRTPTGQEHCRH